MRADLKRGFLFSMMRRDRREERNKGMSLLFAGFQGRFATMLASESEGTEAVTHLPLSPLSWVPMHGAVLHQASAFTCSLQVTEGTPHRFRHSSTT